LHRRLLSRSTWITIYPFLNNRGWNLQGGKLTTQQIKQLKDVAPETAVFVYCEPGAMTRAAIVMG
jgi:hypothetical protein